ncbi:glycosyltransferase [Cohnella hashimotonis]|uniref:Glycosyltransferase n=1 Tax=Cohnella hashimotonis TaxID=2826895 RepID=A0ABT6TT45_9BACL|nr:glycosyltransferase [Cohnella hashimotonis]MDI4650013.1 glycosyltransferase [Cohnella hashimotonis]
MKVAVLTMFNGLSPTYSLVQVAELQLRMLLDAGIDVRLLVSEDCPRSERYGAYLDERLAWVPVVNRHDGAVIHWRDYTQATGRTHDRFDAETETIAADFVRKLEGADVCIMHDILYQGWHLVHNVAIRKAQLALPDVRFLSMVHSAPAPRPLRATWPFSARYKPMPRTLHLYPTASGIPALARQYGVSESDCRVMPNGLDPLAYASPDTKRLAAATDLLSPDVLMVCPGRLTPAKRFDKAAALAGALSAISGLRVKLVCCDFPAMDAEPSAYKQTIRLAADRVFAALREESRTERGADGEAGDSDCSPENDASASGMTSGPPAGKTTPAAGAEVAFTSDLGWPDGYPHRSVMDLFGLANLFVCPSYSESFGLVVLEAASRGNLLVLNEAVPALAELGGQLGAYMMRWDARNFGFDTAEAYNPSEEAYLFEHARRIAGHLADNPVLRAKAAARQRYSPRAIWEERLWPLLAEIGSIRAYE